MRDPSNPRFDTPDLSELQAEAAASPTPTPETPAVTVSGVRTVLNRHRNALMAAEGVVMVGEGQDELGRPAIIVGVKQHHHRHAVPPIIDGVPVIVTVIGEVDALTVPDISRGRR